MESEPPANGRPPSPRGGRRSSGQQRPNGDAGPVLRAPAPIYQISSKCTSVSAGVRGCREFAGFRPLPSAVVRPIVCSRCVPPGNTAVRCVPLRGTRPWRPGWRPRWVRRGDPRLGPWYDRAHVPSTQPAGVARRGRAGPGRVPGRGSRVVSRPVPRPPLVAHRPPGQLSGSAKRPSGTPSRGRSATGSITTNPVAGPGRARGRTSGTGRSRSSSWRRPCPSRPS